MKFLFPEGLIQNSGKPQNKQYDAYRRINRERIAQQCDFITEQIIFALYNKEKTKGVLLWQKGKRLSASKSALPADAA